MKVVIDTVPHAEQRYETPGDYWEENGVDHIRVSEMRDWRYEFLVAVHELIEMTLAKHRGITEAAISQFDREFEERRLRGLVKGEPGDDPAAPYRKEHFCATNMERILAAELGVDWAEYEEYVDALGTRR